VNADRDIQHHVSAEASCSSNVHDDDDDSDIELMFPALDEGLPLD